MSCVRLYTKKYTERPGPPYSAQDCKGRYEIGNDGYTYQSVAAANGIYRWKKTWVAW